MDAFTWRLHLMRRVPWQESSCHVDSRVMVRVLGGGGGVTVGVETDQRL